MACGRPLHANTGATAGTGGISGTGGVAMTSAAGIVITVLDIEANGSSSLSTSGIRHAGNSAESTGSYSCATTAPAQMAWRVAADRRRHSSTANAAAPN